MRQKLTLIMPVYNEETAIIRAIRRVLATSIKGVDKELIIVNDGSTDGTGDRLKRIRDKRCLVLNHKKNRGKGAAVRTALEKMSGDLAIIQDADLEYDPADINLLLAPILNKKAEVVFGSRFLGAGPHRVLYFWHGVANSLITFVCDALTNLNLTDIETGYKAFTREVAESIKLKEEGFNFDPEFTVKVAKKNFRIYEVGISYAGRSYAEGKKIKARDGLKAIWAILKYSLIRE